MFGMEGNLDMIKKKVSKVKVKAKSKVKSKTKIKAKKVSKKANVKVKNPVYLDSDYLFAKAYNKYVYLIELLNRFVYVHSNTGIMYGALTSKRAGQRLSRDTIKSIDGKGLDFLNTRLYILKTNYNQMPNRDDLSLIAENNDYLGNELFWDEHDEFRKDSFKKSTDYQFTLESVDKIIGNRIYVRRLKQVKSKND